MKTKNNMSIENVIRLFAGSFILISLALATLVNPLWLLFTAFVGLNLIQSSLSKWCLLEKILQKTWFQKSCKDS